MYVSNVEETTTHCSVPIIANGNFMTLIQFWIYHLQNVEQLQLGAQQCLIDFVC